jgi:hypothetical protein
MPQAIAVPLLTTIAGGVVAGLLAPKSKAPELPPVTPMPDPLAQEAARKKAIAEQMSRSGRQSTILTDASPDQKLGG